MSDTAAFALDPSPPDITPICSLAKNDSLNHFCLRRAHNEGPIAPRVMGRGGTATRGQEAAAQAASAEHGE